MADHDETPTDINQLLKNATAAELRQFITRLTMKDDKIYKMAWRRFSLTTSKEKLKQVQTDVRDTIRENTRSDRLTDQAPIVVANFLDEITADAVEMIPNGDLTLAFNEVLLVIKSAIGAVLKSFDNEHHLEVTLDHAYSALEKISQAGAKTLTEKQKTAWIKAAIKVFSLTKFDTHEEMRFPILFSILPVASAKTLPLIEMAAYAIGDRYKKSERYIQIPRFRDEKVNMAREFAANLQSQGLITIGEIEDAKAYMDRNMHFYSVRRTAVNFYIDRKDFKKAIELAEEGFESSPSGAAASVEWLDFLEKIYLATHQPEKLAEVYKKHMLTGFDFLSYYRKYKALMEKLNKWHLGYPQLLDELATAFSPDQVHYAEVLVEEHELDKLLALAKQKSEILIAFGNILYPAYSDEVNELYFKMVTGTDIGKNRQSYQKIANMILNYAKYGDKRLAEHWCQVLVDKHPDRSAFIDEIQRAYDRI